MIREIHRDYYGRDHKITIFEKENNYGKRNHELQ